MINYNLGFLLILIVMISACSQVKEENIYGTYIAEYSFGTEKVTLNANGEYSQEVYIKNESKTLAHKGRWRYEARDKYIELENALDVADLSGGLKKDYDIPFDGLVLMKVKRVFPSSIRLGSAYEDVDFIKTKEKK